VVKQEKEDKEPELPQLPQMDGVASEEVKAEKDYVTVKQEPNVYSLSDEEDGEDPPLKKSKSSLSDLLDVYIVKEEKVPPKSALAIAQEEISNYLQENVKGTSMETDPLSWWKNYEGTYPLLAQVAKEYLVVPATSVPCERVFSTAGDIVRAERSSLKPTKVDMLLFLKKNT